MKSSANKPDDFLNLEVIEESLKVNVAQKL